MMKSPYSQHVMMQSNDPPFTAQVVTVSTRCAQGEQDDQSGPLASAQLAGMGMQISPVIVIPDDRLKIAQTVLRFSDLEPVSLLLFTGGTGPTPDDLTPEAILPLLDRRYEGIEAAIHADGRRITPKAPLSRIAVGARGQSVIVFLPGSPSGVKDALTVLQPLLLHLLSLTQGRHDPH